MRDSQTARTRLEALYRFDLSLSNGSPIAGCDEAGRGALAGPACVACVSIDLTAEELVDPLIGVDDSKRLTPKKRAELSGKIGQAASVGIGWAAPAEIDRIGIVPALRNAARRAYSALGVDVGFVLLDRGLSVGERHELAFTRGDSRSLHIAAASIIAKVTRDRLMERLDRLVPGYGFARHKGYGTASHRASIARLGRSPIHRRSFKVK